MMLLEREGMRGGRPKIKLPAKHGQLQDGQLIPLCSGAFIAEQPAPR